MSPPVQAPPEQRRGNPVPTEGSIDGQLEQFEIRADESGKVEARQRPIREGNLQREVVQGDRGGVVGSRPATQSAEVVEPLDGRRLVSLSWSNLQ